MNSFHNPTMQTKEYSIEHYPKFKEQNLGELSIEQVKIRKSRKKVHVYGDTAKCNSCSMVLPINEFRFADKKAGRRHRSCRDCCAKRQGVKEIGKVRFAMTIAKKGFRNCRRCLETKPVSEFTRNKSDGFLGRQHTCKACMLSVTRGYQKKQNTEIGLFYIKQYAKRNYGLTEFDETSIENLKKEILDKRSPKYFMDGQQFVQRKDLIIYIEKQYGIPKTATSRRLWKGWPVEDLKISLNESRIRANKAMWEKRKPSSK